MYIPAGTPHLPYNTSETEACTAVIARTDPNDQESVVPFPDLDELRDSSRITGALGQAEELFSQVI